MENNSYLKSVMDSEKSVLESSMRRIEGFIAQHIKEKGKEYWNLSDRCAKGRMRKEISTYDTLMYEEVRYMRALAFRVTDDGKVDVLIAPDESDRKMTDEEIAEWYKKWEFEDYDYSPRVTSLSEDPLLCVHTAELVSDYMDLL